MQRVLYYLDQFEKIVGAILLFFVIILVFIAAVLRSVGFPLTWSVAMAQLFFVWVCFIGADVAFQQDRHIGVDILTRFLHPKINLLIVALSYCLILIFFGIIVYYGFPFAIANSYRKFNGMNVSYSWAMISAPVGSLFFIKTTVIKLFNLIQSDTLIFLKVQPVE